MKPLVTPRGSDKSAGDWFNVFNDCDVLGPTNVPLDDIPDNIQVDSSIDKPEGVRVAFIGIVYGDPEVSIVVQLIGTTPFEDPFLPVVPANAEAGTEVSIDHPMTKALVQGHTTSRGKKGHCNKTGNTVPLAVASTLTITATAPD